MTLVLEQRNETTNAFRQSIEDLIEEVRHQTKRRRRRNLAVAFGVVALGISGYFVAGDGNGGIPSAAPGLNMPGVPPGIASAVDNTLAARSVEIIESDQPGVGIYQAPDLFAAEMSSPPGVWATWYVSGNSQFYAVPRGIDGAFVRQFPGLRFETSHGISPAQQRAFQSLVDYFPYASDFAQSSDSTYSFRLSLPRNDSGVTRYTSGELSLSNGYVDRVTLRYVRAAYTDYSTPGVTSVRAALETHTSRYERFDDNPRLGQPDLRKQSCQLTAGSLVLRHCVPAQVLP
jgi:hypothetical protein